MIWIEVTVMFVCAIVFKKMLIVQDIKRPHLFISSEQSVAKKKLLILGWQALKALRDKTGRQKKREIES